MQFFLILHSKSFFFLKLQDFCQITKGSKNPQRQEKNAPASMIKCFSPNEEVN